MSFSTTSSRFSPLPSVACKSQVGKAAKQRGHLRPAYPYSMVEAGITAPTYTPPSSRDRASEDHYEKTFVDDSFDVASFRGSDSGSHAGSHKTHGPYVISRDKSFLSGSADQCKVLSDADGRMTGTTSPLELELGLLGTSHGRSEASSYEGAGPRASTKWLFGTDHPLVVGSDITSRKTNDWHLRSHNCVRAAGGLGCDCFRCKDDVGWDDDQSKSSPRGNNTPVASSQGWDSKSYKSDDESWPEGRPYLRSEAASKEPWWMPSGSNYAAERIRRPTCDSSWNAPPAGRSGAYGLRSEVSEAPCYNRRGHKTTSEAFTTGIQDAEDFAPQSQRLADVEAESSILHNQVADMTNQITQLRSAVWRQQIWAEEVNTAMKAPRGNRCEGMFGAGSSDMDFLRACLNNNEISNDQLHEALRILNTLQSGEGRHAEQKTSIATKCTEPQANDIAVTRLETQLMAMSKDIVKMKAYNKVQRLQQDSERLARIETKLSGTETMQNVVCVRPAGHASSTVDELSARVTSLENNIKNDTPNHGAGIIEDLFQELEQLRVSIMSRLEDQRLENGNLWNRLSKLDRNLLDTREEIDLNKVHGRDHTGGYQADSGWGMNCWNPRDTNLVSSPARSDSSSRANPPGWNPSYAETVDDGFSWINRNTRRLRSPSTIASESEKGGWLGLDRKPRSVKFEEAFADW